MTEDTRPRTNTKAFSLSTMFLAITLVAIALGLIVRFPAVGWPAAILGVPVFFRTARVVQARLAKGDAITTSEKANIFVKTFLIVSALVTLWCVSVVTCIVTLCGISAEVGFSNRFEVLLLGSLFLLAAVGVYVASQLNKAYEARYRREVGENQGSECTAEDAENAEVGLDGDQ